MIGVLIISHGALGESLIHAASHVLGKRPMRVRQVGVTVHNSLVCSGIIKFGTDEQKKLYLPKAAKGEWIGAYSLSEQSSGTDAGSLKCRAEDKGDHWLINGQKIVAATHNPGKAKELAAAKGLHLMDALSEVAYSDPAMMRGLARKVVSSRA